MDDKQLLRYSRQIMLPEVDVEGQQRLLDSHVALIGVGGLGSPAAMYLAAAGIGKLTLVDFDRVELSNLQRQIVHGSDDLQRPKVASARDRLRAINPDVQVETVEARLDAAELAALARQVDVLLDGCDNFATRFAVNAACVEAGTPLVSGAVIRMEGQLAVFDRRRGDSACYRCVFPDTEEQRESCSETGVLAPLPGVIGSLQATEALKLLLNLGEALHNRLLIMDALTMRWRELRLRKDPQCPVCG